MRPIPISFYNVETNQINPDALVTKWNVISDGDSIEIKHDNSFATNYDIDWGDGNVETGVTSVIKTHTYATAGLYIVQITGDFVAPSFGSSAATNRDLLMEMMQWGTIQYKYMYRAFRDCGNMTYTATDAPDLSTVSATQNNLLREMFNNCASITGLDLTNWVLPYDNAQKQYMAYRIFYGLSNCENLNISGWDLRDANLSYDMFRLVGTSTTNGCNFQIDNINFSRNTNLTSMFHSSFVNNISVSNWQLSSTASVSLGNFFQNTKFNTLTDVDLSSWTNTSAITNLINFARYQGGGTSKLRSVNFTGWDTSNVTSMAFWFYSCQDLEEVLGLSGLDASSSTNITQGFLDCKKLSFTNHNFGAGFNSFAPVGNGIENLFRRVGSLLVTPGNAPNVSNWDISGCTLLANVFLESKFNTGVNINSWDFSSCTTLSNFMKFHEGTTSVTLNNISSSLTTIYSFGWLSTIVDLTFDASCDLSGIGDWRYLMFQNANFTTLNLPALASFAGTIGNRMTGIFGGSATNAPTLDIASYDAFLRRVDATIINLQTIQANNSNFTCGGAAETAHNNLIAAGHSIADAGCV